MSEIDPALLAEMLREAMKEGKSPFLTVVSNSMSPLIRRGDQIRLAPAAAEQLEAGEIIVYTAQGNLITHRYWGCLSENGESRLVTKGDRPQHYDRPVTADALVGRVIGRRRNHRFLNLTAGAGKWLNSHLAKVAGLEIRMFSKPLAEPPTQPSNPPNQLFIRLIRRFLYSWAIILTLTITAVTRMSNKNTEE